MMYWFKNLLSPYNIGNITIKNRMAIDSIGLVHCPDTEFLELEKESHITRAKCGFGLIFAVLAMTEIEIDFIIKNIYGSVKINYQTSVFLENTREMLGRINNLGTKIFLGICMETDGTKVCRSHSKMRSDILSYEIYEKLPTMELRSKIDYVIKGAVIAKTMGFDGVEVYITYESLFLDQSSIENSNPFTKQYIRSLEHRLQPAIKIVKEIKAICGQDYPITIRLGLNSYSEANKNNNGLFQVKKYTNSMMGRVAEEYIQIAKILEKSGYDAINYSSGIYKMPYTTSTKKDQSIFMFNLLTEKVKKHVNIPVMISGKIYDPYLYEKAVSDGKADAIVLANQYMMRCLQIRMYLDKKK